MTLHDFAPYAQIAIIGFLAAVACLQHLEMRFLRHKVVQLLASITLLHEEVAKRGDNPFLHEVYLRGLGFPLDNGQRDSAPQDDRK